MQTELFVRLCNSLQATFTIERAQPLVVFLLAQQNISFKLSEVGIIFEHLKTDDYVSVNTVFEQYEKQNMGFVINQD